MDINKDEDNYDITSQKISTSGGWISNDSYQIINYLYETQREFYIISLSRRMRLNGILKLKILFRNMLQLKFLYH